MCTTLSSNNKRLCTLNNLLWDIKTLCFDFFFPIYMYLSKKILKMECCIGVCKETVL